MKAMRESPGGVSVVDALQLRRWALAALTESVRPPPVCSEATWRLFLGTERCALPLQSALARAGRYDGPGREWKVLDGRASWEARKILAVRAQLQELVHTVRRRGWQITALKGTLAAAQGSMLDLDDIDILTQPYVARDLAAQLDSLGYTSTSASSVLHLGQRAAPESLPVEVHVTTDPAGAAIPSAVWNRLEPVPEFPQLWRLAPPDHLWHVLTHLAVQHPYRRGAIRDLLLVREAVRACTDQEIAAVRTQITSHLHRRSLGAILDGAQRIDAAKADSDDLFMHDAALVYALKRLMTPLRLPQVWGGALANWIVAFSIGRAECRYLWERIWHRTHNLSAVRSIAWLEVRSPRVGRFVRVTARLVRALVALGLAILMVPAIRLIARQARRSAAA